MTKGIIFDIQKFALHDGPGIRTAVFLKGCGLRCRWCCNPESQILLPQLSYDLQICSHSFNCVHVCHSHVFTMENQKLKVQFESCTACGDCITECPTSALKIYGWESDAESIVHEVLKDKAYFDNSDGGITLTGGDPLFQAIFSSEILRLSKKSGLHTCVETAGDYPSEDLFRVAEFTDLFLYDFKNWNDSEHIKQTGVSNKRILSNLDALCRSGKKVILRCPIIPGVNNTIEHFRFITALSKNYNSILAVELMPFHDYGFHKYEQTGLQRPSFSSGTVSEKTVNSWIDQMDELGCEKLIKEK